MREIEEKLKNIGVGVPEILIPKSETDLTKWAVVACDQYTSQPEYWEKVDQLVGDAPSTLRLIFPEVFLEEEGKEARIGRITEAMLGYLADGVLVSEGHGFVFVDRRTSHAASRKGLVVALDLDCYDYNVGSQTLIRATEGTVLDRLPPRIRIREGAALEIPHIMVLIDDPERTVIEPLSDVTASLTKIYDVELMMEGGHIRGYKVESGAHLARIARALESLADPESFRRKYGVGSEKGLLLFAVGDGNHSLATAKACWEQVKAELSPADRDDHPARFALVEIVNVHDQGLQFEPIHRVMFGVEPEHFFEFIAQESDKLGLGLKRQVVAAGETVQSAMAKIKKASSQVIPYVSKEEKGVLVVDNPRSNLEVGTLQSLLDAYGKENKTAKVDYIHGDDVVNVLGTQAGNIGFCLPPMDKNDLFKTVIIEGVLPRKTFSMGEAEEKRFYLECRKIVR